MGHVQTEEDEMNPMSDRLVEARLDAADDIASRRARNEMFKAAFLVIAFLAIGFAGGIYWERSHHVDVCQPAWNMNI